MKRPRVEKNQGVCGDGMITMVVVVGHGLVLEGKRMMVPVEIE